MERPIYLDYNATTPLSEAALRAMMPFLREEFGNPSSSHAFGTDAARAVGEARAAVARTIHASPHEIAFTAGGSETDNLALKGAVLARLEHSPHVVSTTAEHPAVLSTLAYLHARFGVSYTLVPVDEYGLVSVEAVEEALRPTTVLVSVMHANNETGTIAPIERIGALTRERGILFHVDAAQSVGKIGLDVRTMNVDLMTMAAHKLYGPKGMGALYMREGVLIDPLIHGSGQEWGQRAGTENVAGIVAFGAAIAEACDMLPDEGRRLLRLRDELHRLLLEAVPGLLLNGHPVDRLPNTLNVSFPGVSGNALLANSPGVAASTGSACHSGLDEPSPVLLAMGLAPERCIGAVRLSCGRRTTEGDIQMAAERLIAAYRSVAVSGNRVGVAR